MRILITGSNGLLGQKIIYNLLSKKNTECIATAIGENRTHEKNGYVFRSLDITKRDEVERIFDEFKPDALINTAAMTNVDACESQKEACDLLNISAVEYLIKACEKHNTHFVHLSTDFVFDGTSGPYKETDEPNPLSYYAISKYEGEKLLMQSKLSWTILRTIIIYGVVDDNVRSNVVLWTRNALLKEQTIKVISDQFRSPTLAEDLAEACVQAALRKAKGVYHVSGSEGMYILEIVERTADFFGLDKKFIQPVSTAELNQPAARPLITSFNIEKARRDLGFNPHTFSEGLQIVKEQLEKADATKKE